MYLFLICEISGLNCAICGWNLRVSVVNYILKEMIRILTSKQRSYLRGLANKIDPIFQVGKGGVNDNLINQVAEALEARELIKISVLNNSDAQTKEAAEEISLAVKADVVQVIGSKFTLYKESKEPKIILP